MEFDLTVEALRENDQTTRVVFEDREDTEMSFGVAPWLSDDEATGVHDESAALDALLSDVDDEDETEVRAPTSPLRARKWASRAGPALYPSVEVILPARVAPAAEPRACRGHMVSLVSLGLLCFALATVLLTQARPVGTVRRLPVSTSAAEAAPLPKDVEQPVGVVASEALRADSSQPAETHRPKTPTRAKPVARVKRTRR